MSPALSWRIEPSLADNNPPDTNIRALDTPDKNLMASKFSVSRKKPHPAMKIVENRAPDNNIVTAPHLRINSGVLRAPKK